MKNKLQGNIHQIATQFPGEVRPMTHAEREWRKAQASKLRQQAAQLILLNKNIKLPVILEIPD